MPTILSDYMFWWGGIRPAMLKVSPYIYRVRMRIAGSVCVTEEREYKNFMASKL